MLQINKGVSDPQIACCQNCYHLQQDPQATLCLHNLRTSFFWWCLRGGCGGNLTRYNRHFISIQKFQKCSTSSSSLNKNALLVTATSNAHFWVWVHTLVNLVAMAFLFTMNLYLPWVLNFNLSQARLLKETACKYVFFCFGAWNSIHQCMDFHPSKQPKVVLC